MTSRMKLSASLAAIAAGATFSGAALANDDVVALVADPGNVVMPSITYNGWNYSTLDQITLDNVDQLQIAWTWQVGILDSHEASPLVIGDTMYIVSPKPNYVYALDLNTDGVIIWEFRPDMNVEEATRQGCCGAQTRGLNYAEGKVFFNTLDGQFFALDAETGEALWRTVGADLSIGETTVGNQIVIGDLLIGGNAGGERGVRGKVQAFDINTGQLQWVMYNMGPDNEVGITPGYQAFYPDNQHSLQTWYGDSWRRGGGTVWGYFTADLERNAFYYSTGNCGPWNPDYRREWGVVTLDEDGGLADYRNNWCASTIARDATDGHLLWAFNNTPADPWDYDEPLINPLVTVGGTDAVIRAARNGYFFVWDRDTGELLREPWPHVYVNWSDGYNMETGRARQLIDQWTFTNVEDRRNYTTADPGTRADGTTVADYTGTEVVVCPSIAARNWQNDAYSPRTGMLYTPYAVGCRTQVVIEGEFTPGEGYTLQRGAGAAPIPRAYPDYTADNYGELIPVGEDFAGGFLGAIDVEAGEFAWRKPWIQANNQPIMATATDLLFQAGVNEGVMRALDATNGETVWEFRTGSRFNQSPITYIGPDGKQYLAIIASSAAANGAVAFDAAPDNQNRYRRSGSTLYVFALPDAVAGN
ncbi:MAG: PQQ-binding-like beta-propeller repeat protein [Bauldia sp.]|nr:PQQ-binding-like beta-propeller repeat protein [Bauldia sp.]